MDEEQAFVKYRDGAKCRALCKCSQSEIASQQVNELTLLLHTSWETLQWSVSQEGLSLRSSEQSWLQNEKKNK